MRKEDQGCTSALYVCNGLCIFWGTSFNTQPHKHNTLQLVFDIEKEFLLRDKERDWTSYSAAIIDASHIHQLDSNDSIQLFIYIDADSAQAKYLKDKYLDNQSIQNLGHVRNGKLSHDFFRHLLVQNSCEDMFRGCQTILTKLIDLPDDLELDPRVLKAIEFIANAPVKTFKVEAVAKYVALSESRLRHLFKAQVGQSLQNYIVWMRVIDSLNDVLKGKKLIDTAYNYGFSDASHMTKSFIEVIGIPPSKIETYVQETRIITCRHSPPFHFRTEVTQELSSKESIKNIIIET